MNLIKILVATHRSYKFPNSKIYLPIQVGKIQSDIDLNILGDNNGQNISSKNKKFCELTALYWAWKNDFFYDSKYCGLVHYRRYFSGKKLKLISKTIASEEEILENIYGYDILLPKKRNYFIENIKNHYSNAHYKKDLDETRKVIIEIYPEYLDTFDIFMRGKKLHLYNMFIMKTKDFNKYCKWLFDILFELEKRIDTSNYDTYQSRVYGFLGERLLNIWVIKNNLKVKESKVVNIEGENLVKKVIGLLNRKIKKGF